jgi:inorganic triphosphatase YgiF
MEIEIKLLLEPGELERVSEIPEIARLRSGPTKTRALDSVYYDTSRHALRKAGIALRLRNDGGQWIQTLKASGSAAGGLHERHEWEWPLKDQALDLGLIDMNMLPRVVAGVGQGQSLIPAFATRFIRSSIPLRFQDGSEVELCLDHGEIVRGSHRSPIAEVEIELIRGSASIFQS